MANLTAVVEELRKYTHDKIHQLIGSQQIAASQLAVLTQGQTSNDRQLAGLNAKADKQGESLVRVITLLEIHRHAEDDEGPE